MPTLANAVNRDVADLLWHYWDVVDSFYDDVSDHVFNGEGIRQTWAIVQLDLAAEAGKDCGNDEFVVLALAKVVVPPLLAPCIVAGANSLVLVECAWTVGGRGLAVGLHGVGHGCTVAGGGERC